MCMHADKCKSQRLRKIAEMMLAPEATRATIPQLCTHITELCGWSDIPNILEFTHASSAKPAPGAPNAEWLRRALAKIQSHSNQFMPSCEENSEMFGSSTMPGDGVSTCCAAVSEASTKIFGVSTFAKLDNGNLPGEFSAPLAGGSISQHMQTSASLCTCAQDTQDTLSTIIGRSISIPPPPSCPYCTANSPQASTKLSGSKFWADRCHQNDASPTATSTAAGTSADLRQRQRSVSRSGSPRGGEARIVGFTPVGEFDQMGTASPRWARGTHMGPINSPPGGDQVAARRRDREAILMQQQHATLHQGSQQVCSSQQ